MTKDNVRFFFSNMLMAIAIIAPVCLTIAAMCLIFG